MTETQPLPHHMMLQKMDSLKSLEIKYCQLQKSVAAEPCGPCGPVAHPLLALLSFVFVLLITTDQRLFPGLAHPFSKSFHRWQKYLSTVQAKRNALTNWAIQLEFGYNQLHAMLSLWANWLQLNSQLNSSGVSFCLYRISLQVLQSQCQCLVVYVGFLQGRCLQQHAGRNAEGVGRTPTLFSPPQNLFPNFLYIRIIRDRGEPRTSPTSLTSNNKTKKKQKKCISNLKGGGGGGLCLNPLTLPMHVRGGGGDSDTFFPLLKNVPQFSNMGRQDTLVQHQPL